MSREVIQKLFIHLYPPDFSVICKNSDYNNVWDYRWKLGELDGTRNKTFTKDLQVKC